MIDNLLLLSDTDLLPDLLLDLVAVLLLLLLALLLGLVAAHCLLNLVAGWPQLLLLLVVAHLAGHRLALLDVDVLLGLLGPAAGLQLALLHGLAVAVLLLHGVGEVVGELLAPLAGPGLAQLLLHLPGGVVALLGGDLLAGDAALAVLGLALAAVTVDREDTGLILGGYSQVIHGIAHPVIDLSAPLHGVLLLHHLVLDGLGQLAYKLSHIEALPLLELVDDSGAVLLEDILAELFLLGVASLLHVGHALIGVHNLDKM